MTSTSWESQHLALRFDLVAAYLKSVSRVGYGQVKELLSIDFPGRETCVGCKFSLLRM